MSVTSPGPMPESSSTVRMHRTTPSGFGNVIVPPSRCPPELQKAETSSQRIGASRASALSSDSSRRTPAPLPGTKPHAVALMGREPSSGASLNDEQRTLRIASKPAQIPKWEPSAPPTYIASANPKATFFQPSKIASVPVVQAELFVDTWPPRPRILPTVTLTLDPITFGTASAPIAATPRPGSLFGACPRIGKNSSYKKSMPPPRPLPMNAPDDQS